MCSCRGVTLGTDLCCEVGMIMGSLVIVVTLRRVTSGSMIETETFLLSKELSEVREFEDHFRTGVSEFSNCLEKFSAI